jgi:hypothetical protein
LAAVTPTPETTTGLRRSLLESMVKKLAAAYAEADDMRRWRAGSTIRWGLLFGLIVGWAVGEAIHAANFRGPGDPFPAAFRGQYYAPSTFGGIAAGLVVCFMYVFITRSGVFAVREDAEERATRLAEELATEFPAEVAAWGGPAVLRDPALVRQIRDDLNPHVRELLEWKKKRPPAASQVRDELDPPEPAPPSPTSTLAPDEVTADPTRKAVLVARLREHAKLLKDTNDNISATWVGLVVLCIVLPPVGGGVFYASQKWFGLDAALSGLFAAVAVLAVGGLIWLAMAAIRRHLRRKWEAAVTRFGADYPKLVESWGGPQVLRSGETLEALLRAYDPAAVPQRGLFRRLFDG